MPELTAIRGVACLAVLFFHGFWWYIFPGSPGLAGWLSRLTAEGFRGVNLFFVLSGLLITNILLAARERPDYFRRFYKRRALRILPAYYAMLLLLLISGASRPFLLVALFHSANLAPMLHVPLAYGQLWSLGVEEQFYLLWPMFVRWLKVRTLVLVALGLLANSVILGLQVHSNSPKETMPLWYSAHGLALGALLAVFLRSRRGTRQNATLVAIGLTGTAFSLFAAEWIPNMRPQAPLVLGATAWDLLFAALLLAALLVGSTRHAKWIQPRVLLFFGEISYGLYLVHGLPFGIYRRIFHPVDNVESILLQFAICATASIALATLSRFTLEQWFLDLKDTPLLRKGKRPPQLSDGRSCSDVILRDLSF